MTSGNTEQTTWRIFKMEITNRSLCITTTINLLAKVYSGSEAAYTSDNGQP
jgi:hypothetical protein